MILLQLLFQTVGWGLGSLVWNSLRPGVNSLDPDIPLSITDGLINGDFAATNLALAAGQVTNEELIHTINSNLSSGCSTLSSGVLFSSSSPPSQPRDHQRSLLRE